jgi:hypothetical protein
MTVGDNHDWQSFEGMRPDMPILDDPARFAYYREETEGLMAGLFEPVAAPGGWIAYQKASSLTS